LITAFDILLMGIAVTILSVGLRRCRSLWRMGQDEDRSGNGVGLIGYLLGHKKILKNGDASKTCISVPSIRRSYTNPLFVENDDSRYFQTDGRALKKTGSTVTIRNGTQKPSKLVDDSLCAEILNPLPIQSGWHSLTHE